MRKIKYLIPIIILFLTIGFASVNSSLSMRGDTLVHSDIEDFSVYFSNVKVNGEKDLSLVKTSKELDFTTILEELGNTYIIEYEITNGSSAFDAEVSISCSESNDYLEVINEFNSEIPIKAKESQTGTLSLKKIKTNASDIIYNKVSCKIIAEPIEIPNEGSGEVSDEFETITFTLNDTTYKAIKGMSFEEWTRSVHNIDNKAVIHEDILYYNEQPTEIAPSTIITDGTSYKTTIE